MEVEKIQDIGPGFVQKKTLVKMTCLSSNYAKLLNLSCTPRRSRARFPPSLNLQLTLGVHSLFLRVQCSPSSLPPQLTEVAAWSPQPLARLLNNPHTCAGRFRPHEGGLPRWGRGRQQPGVEGQVLGRGCTGWVQGPQSRSTESWAWTDSPREQRASCALGTRVETIEAKVKPKVPAASPCLLGAGILRAGARPRAQRDWDSGHQYRLRYCLVHAHQWVRAPSLTLSDPSLIS